MDATVSFEADERIVVWSRPQLPARQRKIDILLPGRMGADLPERPMS